MFPIRLEADTSSSSLRIVFVIGGLKYGIGRTPSPFGQPRSILKEFLPHFLNLK
ncbi:MAG: hypothetical protein ACI9X4_001214 [Glaciecola sp.]|jgi:hypothetical protein